MSQNLEQLRASSALAQADKTRQQPGEGNCLSGYPSLIINNGLLAALAFSLDKQKQHLRVADAIATHLHQRRVVPQPGAGGPGAKLLLDALSKADSFTLRRATDEALAFLAYLKRFAK
jgi:CRISPR-associated protein Cmr5